MTHRSRASRAFSAVELMVTLVVLGIIVAIAYPAYTEFVERSRRSEAREALQNLATLQEQFYTDNKFYFSGPHPGGLGMPGTTQNDYYSLRIPTVGTVAGTAQSYVLEATALGTQSSDTECATIQMDSNGAKAPANCW